MHSIKDFDKELEIKVSIPFLKEAEGKSSITNNDTDMYFGISKNGYLITNVYGSQMAFNIGTKQAEVMINTVCK